MNKNKKESLDKYNKCEKLGLESWPESRTVGVEECEIRAQAKKNRSKNEAKNSRVFWGLMHTSMCEFDKYKLYDWRLR